jgi:hypothetical protein
MDTVTCSPPRMSVPSSRASLVAYRSTTAAAGSSRSDSSIAAGTRPRSASTSSSWAGEESRCSRALAIMPSVVSIPPNIMTAAFEIASASVSGPAASDSREAERGAAITSRRLAASSANAAVPAAPAAPAWGVAASACTAATIPSYQARIRAGSAGPSPSASAMTATASGPATARRSSAAPRGSMADTRRPVSARVNEASRAWISSRRKARLNGPRWRACCVPSSESMLGPTTLAVEKRGSSTVNVRASRRTSTARSYPVTSQAPREGTQLTGAVARSRASAGCGSASRSASVTESAGVFGAGTLNRRRWGRRRRVPRGGGRGWPSGSTLPLRAGRPGNGRASRHHGQNTPAMKRTCGRWPESL